MVDCPSAILETFNLSKSYFIGHIRRRKRPALIDLSLTVQRGEIFGYLGPNGSGKTTTLKLLMGVVFPDAGTVRVFGQPLQDTSWKYRVGYLPEQPYFYDYLTAEEYLDYVGRLFGLDRAERKDRARRLLERVGLLGAGAVPLRRFSKGMVQRVGLAQALLNDPELVFLDEPMSGLDPLGRRLVRDIIVDLKREGRTVFFSTHILSDAEALCDRVAVLSGGRLVRSGRLAEILDIDVSHFEVLVSGGDLGSAEDGPPGLSGWRAFGERQRFEVPEATLLDALQWVRARGGRILSVQAVRQSLEDFFFRQMKAAEPGGGPQFQD